MGSDAILGIHRPFLSASDLKSQSGDQAISSANQVRATVENYLKEMDVPTKYADVMFSTPKDKVRWLSNADFKADLEGVIPHQATGSRRDAISVLMLKRRCGKI